MLPTAFAVHSTADGKVIVFRVWEAAHIADGKTILFRVYSDTHRDAGGKTMPCRFKRLGLGWGSGAGAGPGLAIGKCFKTSS
jgi:hypothetical protein